MQTTSNKQELDPLERFSSLVNLVGSYDSSGNLRQALEVANTAYCLATNHPNSISIRRAHNVLGMVHYRLYNFEPSTRHLMMALSLAKSEKNLYGEFAALTNITCLFNAIGMTRSAIKLATSLQSFPNENVEFKRLHLQNAVNAMKFGYRVRASASTLRCFHDALCDPDIVGFDRSPLEHAYLVAGKSIYHLINRDPHEAGLHIRAALSCPNAKENSRVLAILYIVESYCARDSEDESVMWESTSNLSNLLPRITEFPEYVQDVLEMLVGLYERLNERKALNSSILQVAMLLREHLIGVTQRTFLDNIHLSCEIPWNDLQKRFARRETVADWLVSLKNEFRQFLDDESEAEEKILAAQSELFGITQLINEQTSASFDRAFRNEAYDVAENWAIASELHSKGSGRALFAVGAIAYSMAKAAGCREKEAVRIGMACRLRDLALISIAPCNLPMAGEWVTDNFVFRRHVTIAADILEESGHAELRKCGDIVRHHHEWWNGCGYPDGLRGVAIPLGSRICAYADVFVGLIFQRLADDDDRWSRNEVVLQIQSMCGVQLDPMLYEYFEKALHR